MALSIGLLILVLLSWYQFIEHQQCLDRIVSTYVDSYGHQIDSIIDLTEEELMGLVPEYSNAIQYRTGQGLQGQPAITFRGIHPIPAIDEARSIVTWHSSGLFAGLLLFCVLFIAIVLFIMIVPLKRLSRALDSGNDDELKAVKFPGHEWDNLAKLVAQSIRQRKELVNEIDQRREVEDALVESEMKLRASIAERERIARDLHDGVIQSVYATGLQLEAARIDLKQDPGKVAPMLNNARKSLNLVIEDIRGFIMGLAPRDLVETGFQGSVERMLNPLRASGIQVELQINEDALHSLSDEQRLNFFFVFQELLSNVVRHSGAKYVKVYLIRNGDTIELIVDDDGDWSDKAPALGEGNGLKNVRKRADSIAATFSIELDEPGWTRALFRMPQPG
ncbi:sensor histidine kinase [Rubellicoccus peritrichatus]|uniref:Histidine kinase n=1 Tax=Rubellicoccus peritrichatus TaxID=3080537 RepID=A0AAQ3QUN7_9BACT|nr:histidine kinase [Puniceicoccus sp. CR14]WOO40125.1 histidine kinase [Puniceicoccus sp. CR14]